MNKLIYLLLIGLGVSMVSFGIVDATYIAVPPSGFASVNVDEFNIALGLVDGYKTIDKFGRNGDVDTAYEDIWTAGGVRTLLTSSSLMTVTTSGQDTSGGTGARTLLIQGLNGTFHETEETITLDSTTPPTTTESYIRILRMIVMESGTTLTNENDITVTAVTGGTTQAHIEADHGQTEMAMYTIPAGYTGYLTKGWVSTNANQEVQGELQAKPEGGSWAVKRTIIMSVGFYEPDMTGSGPIPEKTDLKASFIGASVNNEIMAGFKIILVEN